MRTKIGVITVGSVLALALGVASFRPSSNTRSGSVVNVSLQDVSGKPLSSLFDGMPIDKRYPEFKRLVAEQRSQRCGQRPRQASRLLRELGLWFEPVVHACVGCNCGYREVPPYVYCTYCGNNPYHGNLRDALGDDGIMNGRLVCTTGPNCPGIVQTVNCSCPNPP
ncbi:MAG: hypothetical protein ACR2JB_23940 [Bryobacteraceae bacterium]